MGLREGLGKVAAWFQPAYKKIDEWDVPWLRDACRGIWDILDNVTKKKIFDFVMLIHEKYGEEMAKEILDRVLTILHLKKPE